MSMINKQVLWIITELFPPDETSTSYILGEIANGFCGKYQVKVICGPEIYDVRKGIDPHNTISLDNTIEVFRAKGANLDKNTKKGKLLSFVLISLRLIKMAKTLIDRDDKVLMVTNPAPLLVLMGRLKRRRCFELNILVHDVFPENTIPANLHLPFYGLIKRLFNISYSRADQIIALGRDMADILAKKAPNTKVTIIENWADVDGIKPKPMPKLCGKVKLQYAGNIGRVQAIDKVVLDLSEELDFHIYGTGSMEETLKKIERPNVFFHGPYLRSQQNDVLADCHIALVSLADGMYGLGVPSKVYNILASGRPVLFLGPKNSEIDLLVRENGIGYSGWPCSWKMSELEMMGRKARKLAEQKYSKSAIIEKFMKAI